MQAQIIECVETREPSQNRSLLLSTPGSRDGDLGLDRSGRHVTNACLSLQGCLVFNILPCQSENQIRLDVQTPLITKSGVHGPKEEL